MSVPSMVHRSGDSLIVRSVVSGDALFGSADARRDADADDVEPPLSGDEDEPTEKDLPECKVKRNYSCGTCDYFTQNPRSYLYHLRDVHAEKVRIYECPNCLYASKHFQKLLRHTKMVHGGATADDRRTRPPQQPPTSIDDDEDNSGAGEPEDSSGGEDRAGVFKCSVCSFTAKTRAQLGRHEREEHIKTKFFRCTKCTYVTHMKARFTKHVKYHSMPMIKCDMCDFRTPYKWNLDRHCKNHNGRGAFRCSACNFTADIKQSLTVHEMNHHVPPVGQAAGLGVGRRRNKVGASDATAAEEAARHQEQVARGEISTQDAAKTEIPPAKKQKLVHSHSPEQTGSYGPDFIHPDDIIHHANGNVYIKNKCKLCNFKSAWGGEMAKHEKRVHNIVKDGTVNKPVAKKSIRPIPNLIPIPAQTSVLKVPNNNNNTTNNKNGAKSKSPEEPVMSQQDIKEICAKSSNSSLKDFASLFGSEDVFKDATSSSESKVPDLIPTAFATSTPAAKGESFKQKNASFFDTLKERLMTGAGSGCDLVCTFCGHESKCLTESVKHSKTCGKESDRVRSVPATFTSSSRCQFCRQRCKSSTDLYNHLQTCPEALKALKTEDCEEGELRIDETRSENGSEPADTKPHPMENRVFVWNNIVVPMDIEVDDSKYEYTDDKVDDNVSLDLSVRTQSPGGSESSYVGQEYPSSHHRHSPVPDKIPTHGNDISVAQHKRVFKCPHCSFWASTASRFHVHIVGHLNKKPFECSLCAYRSNWRWDITKHIKLKSVRDPAHEEAKVLMTDETGRRNYTKYNKYLTEIHVSGEQSLETSGGSGTRPKHHDRNSSPSQGSKAEMPKLTRAPHSSSGGDHGHARTPALRPPPPLKAADGSFFAKVADKKRNGNADSKRTLFKCKKCNFRDASREILLAHVKGHYAQNGGNSSSNSSTHDLSMRSVSPDKDEASVCSMTAKGSQAPFRCGHCNQVSNWKHVIQRHCRLKHSGDIRVVSNKNGQEKIEVEDQMDEPDHVDVAQDGILKCNSCPFSCDIQSDFKNHSEGHNANPDSIMKCCYCTFFVSRKEDILEHFKLHGIGDPDDFLGKMLERNNLDGDLTGKRFKCLVCPYVTNSKSQYTYHKQFHRPRGGQYNCSKCSYNVSKRHLLHQHLKVHGISVTPQKQNGDVVDLDDISDEIEEVVPAHHQQPPPPPFESQHFHDIPLVWVSKSGKFSKMFKCRFCPHVNLRKVNIQEHEKMHSVREKNPNSSRCNEVEHRCSECNYVCNNAGVLSSHSKVHQGLYGTVHCLVDQVKSDEEQIRELSKFINPPQITSADHDNPPESWDDPMDDRDEAIDDSCSLFFCEECPARFLREAEFKIHSRLHGVRLFYKCEHCSYSARQKPHLLAHRKVHTDDYQERTKVLMATYMTANNQPQTYPMNADEGDDVWLVYPNAGSTKSDLELDLEALTASAKHSKSCNNVPLSGTELFQQKSEAEQKQQAQLLKEPSPPRAADPQFGTLMNGNPDFIYPTYLRNGRMREKRYKCPKCPSAFEKREQYKVHLNLHGSKQRYRCEQCDYSVKYYANYVQHVKKHKMNSEAQAARRGSNDDVDESEEIQEMQEGNEKNGLIKLSVGDQQAYHILKQRLTAVSPNKDDETKKMFNCTNCPYVNYRKDAVDNHQKRHQSVSGVKNTFTCEHCDYSVPQVHFLRDHTKLHFMPNKSNSHQVDGYMVCDNLKLISHKTAAEGDCSSGSSSDSKSDNGDVIFEEKSEERAFLPVLSSEIAERFNNNDGEKQFVHVNNSGEVLVMTADKLGDKSSNNDDDTKMEEC